MTAGLLPDGQEPAKRSKFHDSLGEEHFEKETLRATKRSLLDWVKRGTHVGEVAEDGNAGGGSDAEAPGQEDRDFLRAIALSLMDQQASAAGEWQQRPGRVEWDHGRGGGVTRTRWLIFDSTTQWSTRTRRPLASRQLLPTGSIETGTC